MKSNTRVQENGSKSTATPRARMSPTKPATAADVKRLRNVAYNYGAQTPKTLAEMATDLECQVRELRQVGEFVTRHPTAWENIAAATTRAAGTVKIEPWRDYQQSITIQLTPAAVRALRWFAKIHCKADPGNITNSAYCILLLALQRPEVVSEWISAMVRYCAAEGLGQFQFMEIALNHPQYRRTKVPQR